MQNYTATARLTLAGDVDPSNNDASAQAQRTPAPPVIGVIPGIVDAADYTVWRAATTSRTDPLLGGRAEPGSTVQILVDGKAAGTTTADAAGRFSFRATLADGLHRIAARYPAEAQAARLGNFEIQDFRMRVNSGLPYDPVTLTFTDDEGHVYSPNMGGGLLGLVAGRKYTMGVNASSGTPYLKVTFEDILISSVIGGPVELTDPDGDGRYTGTFTYSPPAGVVAAAASELRLTTWDGAIERRYPIDLQPLPQPVVRDARTGQPLAGARVTLLEKISPPSRAAYFMAVDERLTGPDGTYAFSVYEGTYRLRAEKTGYQTYESSSIEVDGIWAGRDLRLMPARPAAAAGVDAAAYQVHMTEDGYESPELRVRTASVVEFVNLDLAEHTATGAGWDSGVLAPGESFTIVASTAGTFPYGDEEERLRRGRIVVADNGLPPGRHTWLPLSIR
jgi:plastocyanin